MAFVESNDGCGIRKSEFVESLDDWKKWHGKENHFGIIEGAEKFLELDCWTEDENIVFFYETIGVASYEVDSVASEEKRFF